MWSFVVALVPIVAADPDIGYNDWFTTELGSAHGRKLVVNGEIPAYVQGVFAQSGPAQFEMGNMSFGHALDGFSKTLTLNFDPSGVTFSTQFLQSQFYLGSVERGSIAPGMIAAETTPPSRKKMALLNAMAPNDNNYIKPQKIGDQELMTSDTMYVTVMDNEWSNITETISPLLPGSVKKPHWQDDLTPVGHLCIQANMAHGAHDDEGGYTVAMGCQTANVGVPHYHIIFKLEPSNIRKRHLVAKVPLPSFRRPSYMHQNAITDNHYIIVGTPYFQDMMAVVEGKMLAEGGLVSPPGEKTLFQIVKKSDGSHRNVWGPGFLMGHIINAWEEEDDIVLDLTHYTQSSGGFFERYLLSNILDPVKRDNFPKGTVMRYRLTKNGTVEESLTLPDEPEPDVELPVINPNFKGQKNCMMWAVQWHAEGRSYASTALIKRNICTGERVTAFKEGIYVSEHRFIPRPDAEAEDDGALVGLVFNGHTKESTVQVLDGRTLEPLATAPLGMKVPFPVHTTWYEGGSTNVVV